MLSIETFQVPEKASCVTRFAGTHLLNHRSTISEHSYEVSYYAMILVNEWSKTVKFLNNIKGDILEECILHDVPEIFTGDVPYPVKKRYPHMKKLLKKIEDQFMNDILPDYGKTKLHPWVKFIVKYCDTLAVAREIICEVELGNKQFEPFVKNIDSIFRKLYNDKDVKSIDDWEFLYSLSINTLETLGLDKYVKTSEL